MNPYYEKKEHETDYEYGLRLIKIKNEEKPDDLEWSDIVELLKLDIHRDTLRKSASGSPYSGYSVMKYFEEKREISHTLDTDLNKKYELEQLKNQIRDERNELNKKIREMSRCNNLIKIFKDIIQEEVGPLWEFKYTPVDPSDNDLLVMLSDIHYGVENNNLYNYYTPDVAEKRLQKYLHEILHIRETHHSENCYVFLGGDLISGLIHSTIRIENTENVISQVRQVSILISAFIRELAKHFNKVEVYHAPGNHSRLFQKKTENQHGDYLDSLIPVYIDATLQNFSNVTVHIDNPYDEELCSFNVRGYEVIGVHGHHDQVSNVLENATRMVRYIPDLILMGHRHSNGLKTIDKTKVIECGSLSGIDNYCIENRIIGNPEQVVLVISSQKLIEAYYDIQL